VTEKFIADGIPLTDYEREVLTILQEECAEVIQAASKVLRFGKGNRPPEGGDANTRTLGLEAGDLQHMITMSVVCGVIDCQDVFNGISRKSERLRRFMQTTK
jgi:hypothetical protein